jgi:NAD(P)-dependent dehydrogenase (short-subunit alcohol dehydrogenase family)
MFSQPARSGARRLDGRVAIVTGTSRGLGKAIARGYAREGAKLVVCSRHPEELADVVHDIEAAGGEALAVRCDVASAAEIRAMVDRTLERFGGIDILVNNAGIHNGVVPSEELKVEDWQRVMDVNLTGAFLCSQIVGRPMLAAGRGVQINICSLTSTVAFPGRTAYSVSKAGLLMLTKNLAIEWAARGVRVVGLAPGVHKTEIFKGLVERGVLDEAKIAARVPMRRVGLPDDLVGPAIFLASDEAAYMTGEIVAVDGGWLSYGYL